VSSACMFSTTRPNAPTSTSATVIVAVATPVGRGGIGVVRISGADAARIAAALTGATRDLEPRRATFARVHTTGAGEVADQVIVTFFPSPHSYTGEDVVEISGHGSPVLLRGIVSAALGAGEPWILVLVRPARRRPSAALLRTRYGLTPRQSEVAQRLAEGQSDVCIARALGISRRTAEHHAEAVRLSVGVHSRAALAAALQQSV